MYETVFPVLVCLIFAIGCAFVTEQGLDVNIFLIVVAISVAVLVWLTVFPVGALIITALIYTIILMKG